VYRFVRIVFLFVAANKLIYAMLSDRGRVRRNNQDACAASPVSGVFVVCDGMGGAAGGEVASHLAAETFLAHLAPNGTPHGRIQSRINSAVQAANQAVYLQAKHTPQLSGMGTTLVGLLHAPIPSRAEDQGSKPTARNHPNARSTDPPTLWLVHVGDSRGYLLRRGNMKQLTCDHSLVEEQLRAGQITAAQAAESPMRNLITRAVGSQSTVDPEIHGYRPQAGDVYLLASDGLTRELTDDEITSVLCKAANPASEASLQTACTTLIEAANARGGADNITVLLVALVPA
jgi:protein phosphatase